MRRGHALEGRPGGLLGGPTENPIRPLSLLLVQDMVISCSQCALLPLSPAMWYGVTEAYAMPLRL